MCSFPHLSPAPTRISNMVGSAYQYLANILFTLLWWSRRFLGFFSSELSWCYQPVASLRVCLFLRWALQHPLALKRAVHSVNVRQRLSQGKKLLLLIVWGPVCCIKASWTPSLNLVVGSNIGLLPITLLRKRDSDERELFAPSCGRCRNVEQVWGKTACNTGKLSVYVFLSILWQN